MLGAENKEQMVKQVETILRIIMSFLEYRKTPGSSCCLGMNSIGFGHLRK